MSEEYDGYLIALAETEIRKLDDGRNPKRGPVDEVWRTIAEGAMSQADMAAWAGIIANRVVTHVLDEKISDERRRQALKALGLFGRADENYREQKDLELFLEFQQLAKINHENRMSRDTKFSKFMRGRGNYKGIEDRPAKAPIKRFLLYNSDPSAEQKGGNPGEWRQRSKKKTRKMKIQTFKLFISTVDEKYKRLESHPRLAISFSKK